MSHHAALAFAHELADMADEITLPAFRARLEPETKADGTWVTAADRDTERRLRRAIRERFPHHAVLGEEDGLEGPEGAPTWIVDPIDGTTNFVRGNPIFATLIGLRVEDREVLGVVSAPALGARWDGLVGEGAHRNGEAIAVSDVTELGDAEIAFGDLGAFAERGLLDVVTRATGVTARQRGYGDFWQHCLVAGGSTEIAIEAAVSTWDLAAVRAVVEAAGGTFTDLDGRATADGGSAVSSNGHLHAAALDLVRASTA